MSERRTLFGFHAVGVRLKIAPTSIVELFADPERRDGRMRQFLVKAQEAGVPIHWADMQRLTQMAGGDGHQGIVARVQPLPPQPTLTELLEDLQEAHANALLLILDGVTDPHNLGACLRVADGAGAHAVVAPRDHAASINATVAKVASGAAETMPYFMVTNLARSLTQMQAHGVHVIGAAEDAPRSLYEVDLRGPVALTLGAEGTGLRQLTRKTCDELVHIPMRGSVESLNVSVASGICLYEVLRQRST
jgi:23S rRNA (guanosine2251-2'-O)-methyltransferase